MNEIEKAIIKQYIPLLILASRAYPNLERSGLCSQHQTELEVNCTICYPDLWALIEEHCRLKQEAWTKIEVLERE
jgi:hypothetical protein